MGTERADEIRAKISALREREDERLEALAYEILNNPTRFPPEPDPRIEAFRKQLHAGDPEVVLLMWAMSGDIPRDLLIDVMKDEGFYR